MVLALEIPISDPFNGNYRGSLPVSLKIKLMCKFNFCTEREKKQDWHSCSCTAKLMLMARYCYTPHSLETCSVLPPARKGWKSERVHTCVFYREGWLVIIVLIILGLPLKPPHHATRLITGSVWFSTNWLPVAKICGCAKGSCLQARPIHRICTSKPNTRGYVWGSSIDRAKWPPTSVIRGTIWIKHVQQPDFKSRHATASSKPCFLKPYQLLFFPILQ